MKAFVRGTLAIMAGFASMAATVAVYKLNGLAPSNAVAGGVGFIGFVVACLTLPKPKHRQPMS